MRDAACVSFLRWALPRLGLRWEGFRRPRRQVCRRIRRRCVELGLADLDAYRRRLVADPGEWRRLAPLCRVTISRFFRDREVFRGLERAVLPQLAGAGDELAIWSAGCGAGEEPYSLALLGRLSPALREVRLRIVGSDLDAAQLARARRGVYPESSLGDLPGGWRARAFAPVGEGLWRLQPDLRAGVELLEQDLLCGAPRGPFHLVLCRNLAFTYFAPHLQRAVVERLLRRLPPSGALVVGGHEEPPADCGLRRWPGQRSVWRRC